MASDLNGCKASMKSPTQRYNPFNEEKVEVLSSTETTPAHTASLERMDTTMEGTDQLESGTELEVIRSVPCLPNTRRGVCKLVVGRS